MTQVVYGQKGYLGSSMSVRAAEAYEQGEMPISRWTKTAIIQAVKGYCFDFDLAYDPDIEKKTKAELTKEFLEYKSWHHSSRTAREVEFFGLNEDAVCRNFEPMSQEQVIERDRQMAAEQAAQEARLQFMQSREKEFEQKFKCEGEYVDQLLTFHQLDFSNAHTVTEKFSFEGRPESNEFIGDLDQLFHDSNSLVSSSDIIDIIENGPVEGVSDGGAPYHEHTRLSDKAELAKSACSKIAESEQREPGIEKPTQIEAK